MFKARVFSAEGKETGERELPETLFDGEVLEPAMWQALEEVAATSGLTIHQLCTMIDERRRESSLTAAVRVFLLLYYRDASREGGARSGQSLVERALREPI